MKSLHHVFVIFCISVFLCCHISQAQAITLSEIDSFFAGDYAQVENCTESAQGDAAAYNQCQAKHIVLLQQYIALLEVELTTRGKSKTVNEIKEEFEDDYIDNSECVMNAQNTAAAAQCEAQKIITLQSHVAKLRGELKTVEAIAKLEEKSCQESLSELKAESNNLKDNINQKIDSICEISTAWTSKESIKKAGFFQGLSFMAINNILGCNERLKKSGRR